MSETTNCYWTIDDADESSFYETSCGNAFQFTTDGPSENGFRWCCYCGKRLVEERASDEGRSKRAQRVREARAQSRKAARS